VTGDADAARIRAGVPLMQSRLPSVGTTIFTVMSKLAADVGAINLSQGFPDFDCDPALVDAVARAMRAGMNQYAPMQGAVALREAIAAKYAQAHGATYDAATEVTVTSGGTEAIFDAVAAVVHPGDEVVVLEPCYDSYVPAILLNGGVPVFVSMTPPDYRIDWDAVNDAITPRTRLLMINSPHNPTGSIITASDIEALIHIVRRTGIFIVSDEVYEHIIFDGARHESMARHPELAARSFVIGSFGKTYHVTGWKVGYAVAPAALTTELRKVHQYVTFSTITPVQHAIAEFFAARTGLDELPTFFQRKRDLFLRVMEGSRFTPLPCRGSYFQLMDYSAISDEADAEFAIRITKEHGVASIPTSPFLHRATAPLVVRFCFAKKDETLEGAAERLRDV
jgi:methionine transaminase